MPSARKNKAEPLDLMALSYTGVLERRLSEEPPARKGERTRARLKLWAAKMLEKMGYRDMRVSDICDGAGIGLATFYLYFENKSEITRDVLTDFLDTLGAQRLGEEHPVGLFDAMIATNVQFMRYFEANAGLIRCLLQYGDEAPEFTKVWQDRSHQWYQRVATRIVSTSGMSVQQHGAMLLATYALGGMMDQVFRDLYVERNPHLTAVVRQNAASTDELAIFLARLWYRAAFGQDPELAARQGH